LIAARADEYTAILPRAHEVEVDGRTAARTLCNARPRTASGPEGSSA